MTYEILDNDELLRLALDAMNAGKDADSVIMLKTLVERDSGNAYGQYLLAAQHAQMGLMDRAEEGFRAAVANGLEIPVARFQLGQLLLLKGETQEAKEILVPLSNAGDEVLFIYSRALIAAAEEELEMAISLLREGLALPQSIPVLAVDMQRLMGSLEALLAEKSVSRTGEASVPAASMYLSNYSRQG